MEPTLAQTGSAALVNACLAWAAGVLASRCWLRQRTAQWQEKAVRRLQSAMPAALLACAIGLLLSLWSEAAVMGDMPWLDAWPAFVDMLATTHYGHAGAAALVLVAGAFPAHRRLGRSGSDARYAGVLGALLLLVAGTRVAIGHAYEQGPLSMAVWMEWVHVLAMALWTGIVFTAGWIVLPPLAADAEFDTKNTAAYLAAMSRWATLALASVLVTGIYNAFRVLGSPRDLLAGAYGQVLAFKLAFVLLAVALGGINRFYGLPAACRSGARADAAGRSLRTVITILRVESVALLLVLVAAAILANSAPPG